MSKFAIASMKKQLAGGAPLPLSSQFIKLCYEKGNTEKVVCAMFEGQDGEALALAPKTMDDLLDGNLDGATWSEDDGTMKISDATKLWYPPGVGVNIHKADGSKVLHKYVAKRGQSATDAE